MEQETLKKLQETEAQILSVVDKFCELNNIPYSLYAGTALGAVRHRGFIPWDDDIDICMLREDYNRFLQLWRENPIEGYSLAGDDEPGCQINHSKILKDGTVLASKEELEKPVHHGIWLDIFALDKIPQDKSKRKRFLFWATIRLVYTRGYPIKNKGKFLELLSRIMLILPKKLQRKLKLYSDKKITKYNNSEKDCDLIGLEAPHSLRTIYPDTVMSEFEKINFGDYKFSISKQYDLMLRLKFGDYMQLPPESERVCKHNPEVIKF